MITLMAMTAMTLFMVMQAMTLLLVDLAMITSMVERAQTRCLVARTMIPMCSTTPPAHRVSRIMTPSWRMPLQALILCW